jgi:hypothetical protein
MDHIGSVTCGAAWVRDALVRTRTRYISVIRTLLRQRGYRVPSGSADISVSVFRTCPCQAICSRSSCRFGTHRSREISGPSVGHFDRLRWAREGGGETDVLD